MKAVVSKLESLDPGLSMCDVGVPCMNVDRGGSNSSMSLTCSNGVMRGCVVGEYKSGSGRDSPMDFVSLSEAQICPLGRRLLARWVYRWLGCIHQVRTLQGFMHEVPHHCLTG